MQECVDAVASSNEQAVWAQYAVLPQATHADRRRRVSGAAVVEGPGRLRWRLLGDQPHYVYTGAVECGPAVLVRIRHQRQHAGTDARLCTPTLRDSAMEACSDWTGTRPSCNLVALLRGQALPACCCVQAWEVCSLGSVAAKPKRTGPGITKAKTGQLRVRCGSGSVGGRGGRRGDALGGNRLLPMLDRSISASRGLLMCFCDRHGWARSIVMRSRCEDEVVVASAIYICHLVRHSDRWSIVDYSNEVNISAVSSSVYPYRRRVNPPSHPLITNTATQTRPSSHPFAHSPIHPYPY